MFSSSKRVVMNEHTICIHAPKPSCRDLNTVKYFSEAIFWNDDIIYMNILVLRIKWQRTDITTSVIWKTVADVVNNIYFTLATLFCSGKT